MQVDLDLHEMYYLLESALNGSHLRCSTLDKFVDKWYKILTEKQRCQLFEWVIRVACAGNRKNNGFVPSGSCCGSDSIFMKRYHPENQYEVTTLCDGEQQETYRCFKMAGHYYIDSKRFIPCEYITKVLKLEFPEWNEYKIDGIDYDKNILESDSEV